MERTQAEPAERLCYKPMEAARMLGLGKSKIYELLASRKLPAVRIGTALRIPADALRQWIADNTNRAA